MVWYLIVRYAIRGGVEDTRLEAKAKAKDTKNFEAKAKDRPSRGQGQGPRTQAQVFSKKKGFLKNFQAISKKGLQKIFSGDFHLKKTKKGLRKFTARFLALSNKILTVQKTVLSSSRGQGNFRGLEASRPKPRTSKSVLEAKDILEDSTSVWYCFYEMQLARWNGIYQTAKNKNPSL